MAFAFAALHVPLGIAVYYVPVLALVHGLATVAIAFVWACKARNLDRVACAAAYIVGAEVLWRMARVPLFWEFGKYAVGCVLLVAAIRAGRATAPLLSSLYFVLLIPSAALTVLNDSPGSARAYISFNLSGPFALAAAAWFFSQIRLTPDRLLRVLLSALIPLISISSLTIFSILTAGIDRLHDGVEPGDERRVRPEPGLRGTRARSAHRDRDRGEQWNRGVVSTADAPRRTALRGSEHADVLARRNLQRGRGWRRLRSCFS